MRVLWIAALVLGISVVFVGCGVGGGRTDCDVGAEGCPCTSGGSCDPGLTCLSEVCVDAMFPQPEDTVAPEDTVYVQDVCIPECDGKECGPDGCGGQCGQCSGQDACVDGACVCQPECDGKACGGDGCGGNCGTCPAGESCDGGQCVVTCGDGQCGTGEDQCNCPGDCTGGCAGCCDGTTCQGGTSNTQCGKDGASCTNCTSAGKECQNGQCVDPPLVCDFGSCDDPTSGHTWQVTPTGEFMNWSDAKAHCAGLSLDGGGWRLPTIGELRTLIRGCPGTVTGGACEVTDSCLSYSSCWDQGACVSCWNGAGPDEGLQNGCYWPDEMQGKCDWYWSSSSSTDDDYYAWTVNFIYGSVYHGDVSGGVSLDTHVRCVR